MAPTIEIAPSILSADFAHLAHEIGKVESAGAKVLHLDVMDGHFVPNITIGPPVVRSIRRATDMTLDVHLMVENPERHLEEFMRAGANWISVHVEADIHLNRTLQFLKENGIRAGVALNPATPLHSLDEVLPLADYILVMTVNPGFGGQQFIPSTMKKIRTLRSALASGGFKARVEVDGGIGPANVAEVLGAGAEIIVIGSAIFGSDKNASDALQEMQGIVQRQIRIREAV